jgi:hypothetical protein
LHAHLSARTERKREEQYGNDHDATHGTPSNVTIDPKRRFCAVGSAGERARLGPTDGKIPATDWRKT